MRMRGSNRNGGHAARRERKRLRKGQEPVLRGRQRLVLPQLRNLSQKKDARATAGLKKKSSGRAKVVVGTVKTDKCETHAVNEAVYAVVYRQAAC